MYSKENIIANLEKLIDKIKNKNKIDNKWVANEMLKLAAKENVGFTKEVCNNLYNKLDELEIGENNIPFSDLANEVLYNDDMNGAYTIWTHTAHNNLLLWEYEEEELYNDVKYEMLELDFKYDLDDDLHKTELNLIYFGTKLVIQQYCEKNDIDIERYVTKKDVNKIKDYIKDVANLEIETKNKNNKEYIKDIEIEDDYDDEYSMSM